MAGRGDRGGFYGASDRGRGGLQGPQGQSDRGGGSRGGTGGRGGNGSRGGPGGNGGRGRGAKAETFRINEGHVLANYFPVNVPESMEFYQHGVDFGGVDSRSMRRKLCRFFLREVCKDRKVMDSCIFDGTSIFCTQPLPTSTSQVILNMTGRDYPVAIISVQAISIYKGTDYKQQQQLAQVYNIILKKGMEEALHRIGRNYYARDQQIDLPPDMAKLIRVLPGFATDISFKKFGDQRRLVCNIDTISKVISTSNVLQVMRDIQSSGPLTPQMKQEMRRVLVGTVVFTKYNNTAYTVENIDFGMGPQSSFNMRTRGSGEEVSITYWDYYNIHKNCQLQVREQPLLRTSGRNKQRIYLLPETCLVSDFDPKAKEKLPMLCSVKPQDRLRRIKELPEILRQNPRCVAGLSNFSMTIGLDPIRVNAKSLPPPELFMPGLGPFPAQKNWGAESGTRLNYNAAPSTHITMTAYVTYESSAQDMAREYSSLIQADLAKKAAPRRLNLTPVKIERGEDHIDALKRTVPQPVRPCMLICILGDVKNKANYGKIKEFCNKFGYISQCLNQTKQKAKSEQKGTIVGNLMKQILNKNGILCWWADIPKSAPALKGKSLMLIGIDVYHAKKRFLDKQNVYVQRRSIGAFIAVFAQDSGIYKTSCNIVEVEARQELVCKADSESDTTSIKSQESGRDRAAQVILEGPEITRQNTLCDFITRSCQEHNIKPDQIIVYRDGVGDSQLEAVRITEVEQTKKAVRDAKLIFSVVQKRISTRFLLSKPSGEVGNPAPGMVVDKDLGSEDYPDFYLIPTRCSLSTVKPVHYIMMHNDGALPMDQFQSLTYAMCHCYPNWTDSIKLPFPTQLAHKLAFLMGESQINKPEIHRDLFKTYFYL